MSCPFVCPGYDPVTEIRYLMNGVPAEMQDPNLGLAYLSACDKDLDTVDSPRNHYLASVCMDHGITAEGADRRLATVKECRHRKDRGIGISTRKLQALQQQSQDFCSNADLALIPGDGFGKYGDIDVEKLESALPSTATRDWLRDASGRLRVDGVALSSVDNAYSRALQAMIRIHRDRILYHLRVSEDGRHRSHPNPFGTITGRENPGGFSFTRLSRDQRAILAPASGNVLATIDYQQQEPAIAVVFAEEESLLDSYQRDDLYKTVAGWMPHVYGRDEIKQIVISYLYGASEKTLVKNLAMTPTQARECINRLEGIFHMYRRWSDHYIQEAYHARVVRSLDWRMVVHKGTRISTLRNWPVQAAGADILRRACLLLQDAQIPIVGCIHDSIIMEIPEVGHNTTVRHAQQLMADASAEVLNGFRLRTKIESVVDASGNAVGGECHGR